MRPVRVVVVSEIPTPYRLPLFRLLAARPELELEVLFCAAEQPDRPWRLDEELAGVPHEVLPGLPLTFRSRRNTFVYEINAGIVRRIRPSRADAVVVGGYAVFAEQAAILLAKAFRIPYLLHSESQLLTERGAPRRAAKRVLLPRIVRGAAAGLAVGSAAAEYLAHYGLDPGRIRIVPNTIDVAAYAERARRARADAESIRSARGLPEQYHLFVGRLVEAKGIEDLVRAREGVDVPELLVAGTGPLEATLREVEGVRLLGFEPPERLLELYALAERTIVPSRFEPWGVVVNEALACGCPVVVSDAVGAARDLVRPGHDGWIFPAGDVDSLAKALVSPAPGGDGGARPIERWTYEFAVEQFLEALHLALPGRPS
jgi:glycosyltransferase involved in cell wall biosynthesis